MNTNKFTLPTIVIAASFALLSSPHSRAQFTFASDNAGNYGGGGVVVPVRERDSEIGDSTRVAAETRGFLLAALPAKASETLTRVVIRLACMPTLKARVPRPKLAVA